MVCRGVSCFFLAVFLASVGGVRVYKWDKTKILPQMGLNNWRATSFAIADDKIFLTLVDVENELYGNGVIGAFNISSARSPDVIIFPFQNFYKINDAQRGRITTPMAVRTDDCDRLWLLDAAVQNISGTQVKTTPGIYVFNTKNSQLIRSFNLPPTQWTSTSFFVNFVVGTENIDHDCEETVGYFADFNRFQLLTYDFLRNKSELKSHPYFSPDPLVHTPNEAFFNRGHQDLNGLFGLALAAYENPKEVDSLYFHPLAGTHEFRVNLQALKSDGNLNYKDVEIFKDKGENSESGVSVFDNETDSIFYAEVNTNKIGVFRLKETKVPRQAVYYRYDFNLQMGRIVDLNVRQSELWVLVDGKSDIAIHKLNIPAVTEKLTSEKQKQTPPQSASSASHPLVQLAILNFLFFLPLYFL